ncbi:MAG: hypothetical protein M3Z21_13955 [Pseudomonadota bacterium]|nr:hypothetical protein [Pseudomonadota bacterium]
MADNPAGRFTIGRKRHFFPEWRGPEPGKGASRTLYQAHTAIRPVVEKLLAEVARIEAEIEDKAERAARISEAGQIAMNALVAKAHREVMPVLAQQTLERQRLMPKAPPEAREIAARLAAMPVLKRGEYLHTQALKGNAAVWGSVLAYPKESGFAQLGADARDLFPKLYFMRAHPDEMGRIGTEWQQAYSALHAIHVAAQAVVDEAPDTLWTRLAHIDPLNPGESPVMERRRIPVVVEKAETSAPKDQPAGESSPAAVGGAKAAFFATEGAPDALR